jgi:SPW repeat
MVAFIRPAIASTLNLPADHVTEQLPDPWVLKLRETKAMRADVVIGIVVAVLAAIEIWTATQLPTRQASNR